jgi:glycosyltransferase involved in cell wall biosynthesis
MSIRVTIVHTASLLNLRGSEFWVMDVSNLLRNNSFDVRVVNFNYARRYPRNPNEIKLRLDVLKAAFGRGISLTRLSALSLRLPFGALWHGTKAETMVDRYLHFLPFSRRFLGLLRDSDIIYFVSSQANPSYLLVTLGMSILAGRRPVVAGIHVTPGMKTSELALLKLYARIGVLKAIHVVNKSHISEFQGIGCKLEYVPNGVHYDRFYSDVENKAGQDQFNILFVGAMTQAKGADLLPEIYSTLKSQGIEFVLEICTSGGELMETIRDWSEGKPDVRFKGFIERGELSRLYAHASVALFPSRREAFPMACLEVQASGTPVVVADLPGLTQAMIDHETGIIADGQDANSFAKSITEFYSLWRSERRDYLGMCKRAQENVRDNFEWSRVVKGLVSLFEAVLKK